MPATRSSSRPTPRRRRPGRAGDGSSEPNRIRARRPLGAVGRTPALAAVRPAPAQCRDEGPRRRRHSARTARTGRRRLTLLTALPATRRTQDGGQDDPGSEFANVHRTRLSPWAANRVGTQPGCTITNFPAPVWPRPVASRPFVFFTVDRTRFPGNGSSGIPVGWKVREEGCSGCDDSAVCEKGNNDAAPGLRQIGRPRSAAKRSSEPAAIELR